LDIDSFILPDLELEDNKEIFDFVFSKTKEMYLDKVENKTFVVRVKRT
jgi:hypothetical protein